MKKNTSFPLPAVGGISLLVILAVLSMTVFALLALSAVQADTRLQQASAQAVSAYYAAEREANEILSGLRQGIVPDGVIEQDGVYAYSCRISDTQRLCVEVECTAEQYRVLRWQAVPDALWEPDTDLPVWDGEE